MNRHTNKLTPTHQGTIMKKEQTKLVAYIFEDIGGWYVCDNDLPYLDTRGRAYYSKGSAFYGARYNYTHYVEKTTGRIRKFQPTNHFPLGSDVQD
jgi:hypothetical protein